MHTHTYTCTHAHTGHTNVSSKIAKANLEVGTLLPLWGNHGEFVIIEAEVPKGARNIPFLSASYIGMFHL